MPKSARVNWWRFSPAQILEKYAARTFDRRHGTDTSSFAELKSLGIASANKCHGERYQPSPVYSLQRLLKRLAISYPDFSFIDFGSGKGRTLLVASELPFKQVIGVEFGAELHVQAERNISRYGRRAAGQVRAIHADATQFVLPDNDLVLYFFNPFNQAVLDEVLANINASLRAKPRKIILVYLYLPDANWLKRLDGFCLREQWHHYCIYEYMPASE
jgi:SAM-dependent methyltransferase